MYEFKLWLAQKNRTFRGRVGREQAETLIRWNIERLANKAQEMGIDVQGMSCQDLILAILEANKWMTNGQPEITRLEEIRATQEARA